MSGKTYIACFVIKLLIMGVFDAEILPIGLKLVDGIYIKI